MKATYYNTGHKTANGERFNKNGMTAAHKTLKFGTRLLLEYKGKKVIVRINDRGPFIPGKDLDVTEGVARKLGFKHRGVAVLKVTILK